MRHGDPGGARRSPSPTRAAVCALALVGAGAAGALAPRPSAAAPPPDPLDARLEEVVRPFVAKHCAECHDPAERAGEVVLTLARTTDDVRAAGEAWRAVAARLEAGDMPPDDRPRPAAEDVRAVVRWVREALGGGPAAGPADPGRVTLRRLNRAEYAHTVEDLLGVPARLAPTFPPDDVGYGFDTVGDVLALPPLLLERYLASAEQIAAEAVPDFAPARHRLEAEGLERVGTEGGVQEGFVVLWSNGHLRGRLQVPWPGDYTLRVRAYGQQAGPEPARLVVRVAGRQVLEAEVAATDDDPQTLEVRVRLAGDDEVRVAFTNDFYAPNAPDPAQRDRNLAVDWVEVEGPVEPPPPTLFQTRYVTRRPGPKDKGPQRRAVAREVLAAFARDAWRRPVEPKEVERQARLVEQVMGEGGSFERGLQLALQAMLCSPHFLFRFELDGRPVPAAERPQGPAVAALAPHELATRLSYYLTCSLPDDPLRARAAAGELPGALEEEARRLLAGPRARRFVEQFAGQWLALRRLDTFSPDPALAPGWEQLRPALVAETLALFEHVLRTNASALELLDAPYTFVDERLARHYGLEGVRGPELRRVPAPPGRGGLLGHASVLAATSSPTRTSPVKRGRWVLEALLDDPPPPPLPGMDSLADEGGDAAGKTLRARLELHRSRPECASCHARMDPIGFALEGFDLVGRGRTRDGEHPVDTRGTLPGGHEVDGLPGLQAWLRGRGRAFVRALARQLLVFAVGRGPVAGDDAALDRLVDGLAPEYRLGDLVVGVTRLEAFRERRVGKPAKGD